MLSTENMAQMCVWKMRAVAPFLAWRNTQAGGGVHGERCTGRDCGDPLLSSHRAVGQMMSTMFYPLVTFVLLVICIGYWAVTALYPLYSPHRSSGRGGGRADGSRVGCEGTEWRGRAWAECQPSVWAISGCRGLTAGVMPSLTPPWVPGHIRATPVRLLAVQHQHARL